MSAQNIKSVTDRHDSPTLRSGTRRLVTGHVMHVTYSLCLQRLKLKAMITFDESKLHVSDESFTSWLNVPRILSQKDVSRTDITVQNALIKQELMACLQDSR